MAKQQLVAYWQQGDVILIPVLAIPKSANAVAGNVLAEGEATGHRHQARQRVDLFERNGVRYLRALGETEIVHEEHRSICIPGGTYEVRIVREWDHFAEEARAVQD